MSWKTNVLWVGLGLLSGSPAWGQVTARVSVRTDGGQVNNSGASYGSILQSMSANGRYVAFGSDAVNFIQGDHNFRTDVLVHDRQTGTTRYLSVLPWGSLGNADSDWPSITADGRFVAFQTWASNLIPGDANGTSDILVCDRPSGTLELVSLSSTQQQADGLSEHPSISLAGRFIAFESLATNLAPVGSNNYPQVFVRDRQSGTTDLVSVDSSGIPGDADSQGPSVSEDGRFVVFTSLSTQLVPGDTNGARDVFLRDRQSGTTVRVSVDSNGNEAQGDSAGGRITPNGRFVVFLSNAPNLVPGGANGSYDVFLRDLLTARTEVVSVADDGTRADESSDWATPSPDGRWIAFLSRATNLVAGDTNGMQDVFLRDRQAGTVERMSVTSDGAQASEVSGALWPALSDDGRFVAFSSRASDLVTGDTNALWDIFVRDHQAGAGTTAFTSLCDPGAAGVIDCPCSNPAAGSDRGCDNSAGTGGARLSASGVSRVSMDSLVFTTVGELPSPLSILVQANAAVPNGSVFGQGVRCVGGHLRRLYTKTALGGAIEAPDFAAGEPPVSVRSAQKGDMIIGGQVRWYAVYYRDPTVLGGCAASSTFNATQTGEISWTF